MHTRYLMYFWKDLKGHYVVLETINVDGFKIINRFFHKPAVLRGK